MAFCKRDWLHRIFSWFVVSVFGAVEGLYGRTQYLGDWISYLNVSRAVSSHDWKGIFDPMWNPGYPALIAAARALAPRTAEGEWYAIAALNWIIFLATYASVGYLIRSVVESQGQPVAQEFRQPVITWTTCILFLGFELGFDRVSRVAPDLLVSLLFILGCAQILRVIGRPTARSAAILGLILGLGCWVKSVFVAYAAIFLLVLLLARFRGKIPWRTLAISASVFLALFIPYVSGMSWSYGQLTLGTSGELNYAFYVNRLPHWTNWRGDSSQLGSPLHPAAQLLSDLPVFSFREPFASTYPPYNNLSYWYRGFHHNFSIRNQSAAVGRTSYFLARIVKHHPILCAFLIVLLGIGLKHDWRVSALRRAKSLWPLLLLSVFATATYLLVHVEDRYLGGIFLVLSLLPLTLLLDSLLAARRSFLALVVAMYVVGAFLELKHNDGATLQAALHCQDFHHDPQWKLAAALEADGLRPGDAVALIGSGEPNFRCGWAYLARIRLVAEFGSLPWRIEPWDRTPFDHSAVEQADKNWGIAFWQLAPEQRERVIRAFQATGARAIVSLVQPGSASSGWTPVADTSTWIYSFDPKLTTFLQTAHHAS